jgi:hypothetical protein
MNFIPIFDSENLYALPYGKNKTEYDRLLEFWTNQSKIFKFLDDNKTYLDKNKGIEEYMKGINESALHIDKTIKKIISENRPLKEFFEPLETADSKIVNLSRRKGKRFILRLYAIRIDDDCYAITGGAIKVTDLMDKHPDTLKELNKLNKIKNYLKEQGVLDFDGFYELINEQDD